MSDTGAGLGKVVVNRAMSVDGFIAGPDHAMDWVLEYMKEDPFPEVMAATGAMLVGRGTHEVAKRMSEEDRLRRGAGVRPHASATGRAGARSDIPQLRRRRGRRHGACCRGRKNLEILGADLASQCLQRRLVDEVLVYVLPVLLGDGVRFSTSSLGRIDLEPFSNTQSGLVTMLRFRVRR